MRFARRPRVAAAAALAVALIVLGACSSGSDDPTGNAGKAPDKVTYITSFGQFGRDSYIWMAIEKGYFKDANIDVTVVPGKGTNNVKDVASNKAQFTAVDLTGALLQVDKATSPLGIVAVAAIQQNAMAAVFVPADSNITKPSDLAGKNIADTPGSTVELLFPTYAKLAGFDSSGVKFTVGQAQNLPSMLASGQVDAVDQFVVGQPTVEKMTGKKIRVFPYSDYMSDLYGNALWTNQETLTKNPDLVKRFRDALLKGLRDAVNDPQGAAQALAKHVPGTNVDAAAAELTIMKSYTLTVPNGGAFGTLDKDRVARGIAVLQGAGALSKAIDPASVIDFDMVPKS